MKKELTNTSHPLADKGLKARRVNPSKVGFTCPNCKCTRKAPCGCVKKEVPA